jgi:hypothetical protein
MRHIEFDEKRDWLNILYTNIIPAFKFEGTPRINKSATLLFVFGIEPRPINGLPSRGVLSFHCAIGADPNLIVLAAAADLTQSVDVFGGKRPARAHDRFGCKSCGGSLRGIGTWLGGPHKYNCNISVCGTEVDNTRPS